MVATIAPFVVSVLWRGRGAVVLGVCRKVALYRIVIVFVVSVVWSLDVRTTLFVVTIGNFSGISCVIRLSALSSLLVLLGLKTL